MCQHSGPIHCVINSSLNSLLSFLGSEEMKAKFRRKILKISQHGSVYELEICFVKQSIHGLCGRYSLFELKISFLIHGHETSCEFRVNCHTVKCHTQPTFTFRFNLKFEVT